MPTAPRRSQRTSAVLVSSFMAASSALGGERLGGVSFALQPQRGAIAVFAVGPRKVMQHLRDPLEPDASTPSQRADRVVDALLHRGIDIVGRRDALVHCIGRLVD